MSRHCAASSDRLVALQLRPVGKLIDHPLRVAPRRQREGQRLLRIDRQRAFKPFKRLIRRVTFQFQRVRESAQSKFVGG